MSTHYYPILKWRPAEQKALRSLDTKRRMRIWPAIEILSDDPRRDAITKEVARIAEHWGSERPFFLDPGELEETHADDGRSGAEILFELAREYGLAFVPVLKPPVDNAAAARTSQLAPRSICIRVSPDAVENGDSRSRIEAILEACRLEPKQCDLLLDLGSIAQEGVGAALVKAAGLSHYVPLHLPWRSFILAACAFPHSLANFPRNTVSEIARMDWIVWRAFSLRSRSSGQTLPAFGDYAIQHPELIEFAPPMRMSANIRYAQKQSWLISKGENVFGERGYEQIFDVAKRLTDREDFFGADHCPGCAEIARLSAGKGGKTGNAQTWRWIGTVHHLAVTVDQLC